MILPVFHVGLLSFPINYVCFSTLYICCALKEFHISRLNCSRGRYCQTMQILGWSGDFRMDIKEVHL